MSPIILEGGGGGVNDSFRFGPCEPWATSIDLCSPCNDYNIDAGLLEDKLQLASDILFYASAQQFPGECSETIRPCTASSCPPGIPVSLRHLVDTPFRCSCSATRSCGHSLHRIELSGYPVVSVDTVKIDGATISPSSYWVQDYRYLVRLPNADGTNDGWPHSQSLDLPDTADGTFSVTYTYGIAPPPAGVSAAAALACELHMACEPEEFEGMCRLPNNVASIARQGVTVDFQLSQLFGPGKFMRFNIPEVDMFIATYNPNGLPHEMVVLSPDDPDLVTRVDT